MVIHLRGAVFRGKVLIIGLGCVLRRDDGLGPYIVSLLHDLPEDVENKVRAVALPQLDIVLAPELNGIELLILVDARADERDDLTLVERIHPTVTPGVIHRISHMVDAAALLRLAHDWFGAAPECYMVLPKGYDFSFGEGLSDGAVRAAVNTISTIQGLLNIAIHPAIRS